MARAKVKMDPLNFGKALHDGNYESAGRASQAVRRSSMIAGDKTLALGILAEFVGSHPGFKVTKKAAAKKARTKAKARKFKPAIPKAKAVPKPVQRIKPKPQRAAPFLAVFARAASDPKDRKLLLQLLGGAADAGVTLPELLEALEAV